MDGIRDLADALGFLRLILSWLINSPPALSDDENSGSGRRAWPPARLGSCIRVKSAKPRHPWSILTARVSSKPTAKEDHG